MNNELIAIKETVSRLESAVEYAESQYDLLRNQLLIAAVNSGGVCSNLEYTDVSLVDWDQITIGVGYSSFSATLTRTGQNIKNWGDVPMKPKPQPLTPPSVSH